MMVIEELNSEIVSLSRQVGDLVTLLRERANRLPSRQLPKQVEGQKAGHLITKHYGILMAN